MISERRFSLAVVILAAGRSTRMGRPKMLLPWGNNSVLGHQIELWSQVPAGQIVVVCAAGDSEIQRELDRLQFPTTNRVLNPAPDRGMFSSIECAAHWKAWQPALTHWAVALGDQPHLQPATLRALAEFARQRSENICQPSLLGRARHPVWLPEKVFKTITDSGAHTLKEFLQAHSSSVALLELNDPGLDLDLDLPSDYQAALNLPRVF